MAKGNINAAVDSVTGVVHFSEQEGGGGDELASSLPATIARCAPRPFLSFHACRSTYSIQQALASFLCQALMHMPPSPTPH